jgi:hypothetical protein
MPRAHALGAQVTRGLVRALPRARRGVQRGALIPGLLGCQF